MRGEHSRRKQSREQRYRVAGPQVSSGHVSQLRGCGEQGGELERGLARCVRLEGVED
jgi:hypothetical protein